MGREARRVPLDFEWPLGKLWKGFLLPETLCESHCADCDNSGYSPVARELRDKWYGNTGFHPSETGSTLLTAETLEVRVRAERNISSAPDFYGTSESDIVREAQRLANLWNRAWSHHLAQEDVDALIAADRLWDFTRTWTRGEGWKPIEPVPAVTAEAVNRWSLAGLGHDSINCWKVVKAKCERLDVSDVCASCDGHGSLEKYPGQRDEAEAWEPTDPPTGDGWQLWNTTTEGHPMTPVFATAEELADHCASAGVSWFGHDIASREQWLRMFLGEFYIGAVIGDNGVIL